MNNKAKEIFANLITLVNAEYPDRFQEAIEALADGVIKYPDNDEDDEAVNAYYDAVDKNFLDVFEETFGISWCDARYVKF